MYEPGRTNEQKWCTTKYKAGMNLFSRCLLQVMDTYRFGAQGPTRRDASQPASSRAEEGGEGLEPHASEQLLGAQPLLQGAQCLKWVPLVKKGWPGRAARQIPCQYAGRVVDMLGPGRTSLETQASSRLRRFCKQKRKVTSGRTTASLMQAISILCSV